MRIENLRKEAHDGRARVAADIIWEDCKRDPETLWFGTDAGFADDLTCNPHAFLVGSAAPALRHGERRIALQEPVCPELRVGLETALGYLRHWFYPPGTRMPRIEARTATPDEAVFPGRRSGFFFSGGIDAFATLIANRKSYPADHPGAIKDGLLVFGLEMDDMAAFAPVRQSLERAAAAAGIGFVPVYTNVYLNHRAEDARNRFSFWIDQFQGSAFAAIAHAFANRFDTMSIASSDDIPHLIPAGTHPLLDPCYSSADLRIRYDSVDKSRLEKTRLVAEEEYALDHLRVCNKFQHYEAGRLNCGKCEKCIRTMTALLALGVLHKTDAFPHRDVTPEQITRIRHLSDEMVEASYEDLIPLLTAQGRIDLVRAIRRMLARHRAGRWPRLRRLKPVRGLRNLFRSKGDGGQRGVGRMTYP